MKQDITWWKVIAVCILIAGVTLTIWSAQQQDQSMRNDLLLKTNLANSGIAVEQVTTLNGSPADLGSPEYQSLKLQLGKIRASDPDIRFAYLMSRREDGSIILNADSERVRNLYRLMQYEIFYRIAHTKRCMHLW